MATADILNFMDIDPPTSSELLRSMVALSPEIKQEPEAEEDVYVTSSSSLVSSLKNALCPPISSKNSSPLVVTNEIVQIPYEFEPGPIIEDEINRGGVTLSELFCIHQFKRRSHIKILHDLESQSIRVCRPVEHFVHVDATVHVPSATEFPQQPGAIVPSSRSRPASPITYGNKKKEVLPFVAWLNEQFKLNEGTKEQHQTREQYSVRSNLTGSRNSSPKFNQKISHSSSSLKNPSLMVRQLFPQFSKTPSTSQSSNLISAKRTVEIPQNDEDLNSGMFEERRGRHLLVEKAEKLKSRQLEENKKNGPGRVTQEVYNELKFELSRLRKQMCKDRTKILGEYRQMRQEFEMLRQTILTFVNSQSDNSSKRRGGKEGGPSPKRLC